MASEMTWTPFCRSSSREVREPLLLRFGCRDWVWVGWGVSKVQAGFWASLAGIHGNHDDRALRLDRRRLQSRSWIIGSRWFGAGGRDSLTAISSKRLVILLVRADELAHVLTVSRITIFKQAKAGRIPSFRIGTCVRFDPKAVAEWLRRR
jgi:excisionase family DNA binding protein